MGISGSASESAKTGQTGTSLAARPCPARSRVRMSLSRKLGNDLQPGARIPSLRDLATELKVAQGTVRWAVHDLVTEGALVSRPRSGVFVNSDLSQAQLLDRFGSPSAQT